MTTNSSIINNNRSMELNQSFQISNAFEQTLILEKNRSSLKESLIWFSINIILLIIIIYDLSRTCPLYMNYFNYIECSLSIIFTLNLLYYTGRILKLYLKLNQQILITMGQKKVLGVKDDDPNFTIISPCSSPNNKTEDFSYRSDLSFGLQQRTPLNTSSLSWMSNISQNESLRVNLSGKSSSLKKTPKNKKLSESASSNSKRYLLSDSSEEDECLFGPIEKPKIAHKIKHNMEKITKLGQKSTNLLSSFWSHPTTKSFKDISTILSKNQYQLSSTSPNNNLGGNSSNKPEEKINTALESWTRINVDNAILTRWTENLRMWISQTILERLVKEFDIINKTLEKHGMSEVKIGTVGLERLRKIVSTSQVSHFIPSVSSLLPFLEFTPNQEYLIKRIRELVRGGCMSEFKWKSGANFNGKPWDDTLPTDCAIIMHLLASYLDTQLLPSPNMPDTKAFSGRYYLKSSEKIPNLLPNNLFIQEVTEKPPHYRVIVNGQIYEMVKGHNNLFHSILFFIYHVNKVDRGMLGRVSLGRAGVNMLWIIGLNE